jgi:hypothetical protein
LQQNRAVLSNTRISNSNLAQLRIGVDIDISLLFDFTRRPAAFACLVRRHCGPRSRRRRYLASGTMRLYEWGRSEWEGTTRRNTCEHRRRRRGRRGPVPNRAYRRIKVTTFGAHIFFRETSSRQGRFAGSRYMVLTSLLPHVLRHKPVVRKALLADQSVTACSSTPSAGVVSEQCICKLVQKTFAWWRYRLLRTT